MMSEITAEVRVSLSVCKMFVIIIIIIIIIIIVSFMQGSHTHIPGQTMSLGDTLLQLFGLCCLWCLYI